MDWVEQDTALRIKLNQARQAVARRWLDDEWRRARERFEVAIAELNKELFNHNLRVPSIQLQHFPLRLSKEYSALGKKDDKPHRSLRPVRFGMQ